MLHLQCHCVTQFARYWHAPWGHGDMNRDITVRDIAGAGALRVRHVEVTRHVPNLGEPRPSYRKVTE